MLGTKFVNLSKSLNKWEIIFIYVDANTSPEILLKIEEECTRVRLVEHKGEYGPGWRCKFAGSEPPFKVGLEMVVRIGLMLSPSYAATPALSHSRSAFASTSTATTGRIFSARLVLEAGCTRHFSGFLSRTMSSIPGQRLWEASTARTAASAAEDSSPPTSRPHDRTLSITTTTKE